MHLVSPQHLPVSFLPSSVNLISFCPFTSLLLKVKKAKQWKTSSPTHPRGGKSAKIPPQRGQVKVKIFELVAGAVAAKNSKARVQTSPDEGGSGNGGGNGGGGSSSGGGTH